MQYSNHAYQTQWLPIPFPLDGDQQEAAFNSWRTKTHAQYGEHRLLDFQSSQAREQLNGCFASLYGKYGGLGFITDHPFLTHDLVTGEDVLIFEPNIYGQGVPDEVALPRCRVALLRAAEECGVRAVCLETGFYSELTVAFAVSLSRTATG